MSHNAVKNVSPLQMPWATRDPFLFCVHHLDRYPKGNQNLGPSVSLSGRATGSDFSGKDGFSMYHGQNIPGFPAHPHSGFETVTIGKQGFVDHSDSLGAAGRFGRGDVQWMTAGKGVQHCEMFPLLNQEEPNTLEIFQIWLNLPKASKKVEPHFAMLWQDTIPTYTYKDEEGHTTYVDIVAGEIEGMKAPAPAPSSWAADPGNEVCIWTIKMEPGARWTLPVAQGEVNRNIYLYEGNTVRANETNIPLNHTAELDAVEQVTLINEDHTAYLLLLQGRPINEPVAQYGPFVMNSQEEIRQLMHEYGRTEFGGWPWPSAENVHHADKPRFAKYADGREESRDR
ncbi:pirin family protein [Roseivirga sp. BDSF3-8]|uniref:pirin family protein n=1 Tax=Roseivirga sp. BDSF3-8 TaxID=3241598 RepID=UPI003531F412